MEVHSLWHASVVVLVSTTTDDIDTIAVRVVTYGSCRSLKASFG